MTKVHIIGICGKAMAGLAVMLKEKGYIVSGSDEGFYDPVYSYLKEKGITFSEGYKKENIPPDASMIVIGKHAKLTKEENEEVYYAFQNNFNIKSLPEAIFELAKNEDRIVVAGSFGKSTCTAFITWCLKEKMDPSYMIGAVPIDFSSSHIGKGKIFVIEGDEYPSSNWDNTSKFLYYNPSTLLITSCEHDHINAFPTLADYLEPFKKLVGKLNEDDLLVYSKNGANIPDVLPYAKCRIVSYGLEDDADYVAKNISYGENTTFDVFKNNEKICTLNTKLLGEHNIENILGGVALLFEKNLVQVEDLEKCTQDFSGLLGRLDQKPAHSPIRIFEGYGSSQAKLRSLFESLKLHFPTKELFTIFDPHTFSWRNRGALSWYSEIFKDSRVVLVFEPPTHGASTHDQLTLEEIINEIKKTHDNVYPFHTKDEGLSLIKEHLKKDDIILLSTSGDLGGIIPEVPPLVEKLFPN